MVMFIFLSSRSVLDRRHLGSPLAASWVYGFRVVLVFENGSLIEKAELSYCTKRATSRMIPCLDGMASRHLH
jgi:hypothetical protein